MWLTRTRHRCSVVIAPRPQTKAATPVRRDGFVAVAASLWDALGTAQSAVATERITDYLLATVRGAGLFTSSWALTLWICSACSLSCAVRTSIPFCWRATVDFN